MGRRTPLQRRSTPVRGTSCGATLAAWPASCFSRSRAGRRPASRRGDPSCPSGARGRLFSGPRIREVKYEHGHRRGDARRGAEHGNPVPLRRGAGRGDRAALAGPLGSRKGTFAPPDPGEPGSERKKFYVLDMFPYPSGPGCTSATRGLHRHRHPRPLQAHARLQRAAPDGLGRLRPAGRAVRDPDRRAPGVTTRPTSTPFRRQMQRLGLATTDREVDRDRSTSTTTVDAVDLPADLRRLVRRSRQAGARVRSRSWSPSSASGTRSHPDVTAEGGAAEVERRDASTRSAWPTSPRRPSTGARSWAPCWPTRRSSTARASAASFPVFARSRCAQWVLRITAYAERLIERPGPPRLARVDQEHAAQLDRPDRAAPR